MGEDGERFVAPLDAGDPRFAGSGERLPPPGPRRLVESSGPGSSQLSPRVRVLRVLIPAVFLGAIVVVVAVFAAGLDTGDGQQVIGDAATVRALVQERPRRACYLGAQPCTWLTVVDGEVLALAASGPLGEESGRQGVGWCPGSGGYGSNATGSRFDASGNVVRGPAPRGLDRYRVATDPEGRLVVDFFSLTTGDQVAREPELIPPTGPDCACIPFDREPLLSP